MAADVAGRLKDYAKDQVRFMQGEYERQIIKWTAYIRQVADAQTTAYNDVKDALADIKRKQEEDAQAFREIAMVAFSLVGSVAVSWLSATIQYKLYPRVAALRNPELQKLLHQTGTTWDKYIKAAEKADYSKVAAKVWGDTISKPTGHVLDRVFSLTLTKADSDLPKLPTKLAHTVEVADFSSYKSVLENTMSDEQLRISRQFTRWLDSIQKNQEFGDKVLVELQKRYPTAADDKTRELQGMRFLDEYFDKMRQLWTNDWFYYRHNPVGAGIEFYASRFDREIWAFWILGQDWDRRLLRMDDDGPDMNPMPYYVTKDSGLELFNVAEALADFSYKEFQGLSAQIGKIDRQVAKDEINAVKNFLDASQRTNADELLKQVTDWAKSNPGAMLHGNLEYRTRNLGTIANADSVLADN
jgi:hypothetical protein